METTWPGNLDRFTAIPKLLRAKLTIVRQLRYRYCFLCPKMSLISGCGRLCYRILVNIFGIESLQSVLMKQCLSFSV